MSKYQKKPKPDGRSRKGQKRTQRQKDMLFKVCNDRKAPLAKPQVITMTTSKLSKTGFAAVEYHTGNLIASIDGEGRVFEQKADKAGAVALGQMLAKRADVQWAFSSSIDLPEAEGVPFLIRSYIEDAWAEALEKEDQK